MIYPAKGIIMVNHAGEDVSENIKIFFCDIMKFTDVILDFLMEIDDMNVKL